MGCVASKLEEEEEVVAICRERKRQLKLAVDRRYALADAHYTYCQSLFGVSAAISLFVARHSSPPAPFFITFPPPSSPPPPKENVVSNPLFLQQTPSESTKATIACESCSSSTSSESSEEDYLEKLEKEEPEVCGYFYVDMPQTMPSPARDFGWDFFNPFTNVTRPEILSGYNRISEEDLRVVREQEGIPELEEEDGEKLEGETQVMETEEKHDFEHEESGIGAVHAVVGSGASVSQAAEQLQKGLTVIDTPVRGRELLEALKDIEDHFIRAYHSGKDVTRMLECNRVNLQSNLEEIKEIPHSYSSETSIPSTSSSIDEFIHTSHVDAENSTKLIQALPWRSTSRSSSCKSLVASSSKNSSTWTQFNNDLFDDYGGMASGSHSQTLGRLYAWEKKLYEEVKDGDRIRKIYESKCNQLRNQDARGDEGLVVDKTRAAVKDLYSRILVAIRSAETISNKIEKLRDEELLPQIHELLQGMMKTWEIMMESHEIQNKIIQEVKLFTCPSYGKFCNESHRRSTLQLETELLNWRACFTEYIAAQKAYIKAIHGWLAKLVVPEVEFYSKGTSLTPCYSNGPPLLMICRDWLASMDKLPDKGVSYALKSCSIDVRALWVQKGEEQQQKRKVDNLSRELDRKILAFQKIENNRFEFKLTDHNREQSVEHRDEYLKEKKDTLDNFWKRVHMEKEKHHKCVLETEKITLNGFQTGFGKVFESMTEFSKAAFSMYSDILTNTFNDEKVGKPFCVECSQIEVNGGRCENHV